MNLRKVQVLRGPNIWANYPVLEAWLDLGDLKDSSSDELPGFNDRLTTWLPSLIEHRCSIGERGGFFERLRRGTYQGHILEHVALELQSLAGTPVGFGRTRSSHEDSVYKVIVEYENEDLGKAAIDAALRICLAAVHDFSVDIEAEIIALKDLAQRVLPRPTIAALQKAARARRIPCEQLTPSGLLRLGYGVRKRRLLGAQPDRTSAAAEALACDRALVLNLLRTAGVPAPKFELVSNAAEAWSEAEDLGLPVVIRPRTVLGRAAAFHNLRTREQIEAAFARATQHGPVMVERQVKGAGWRLLVVGERVVAASLTAADSVVDEIPLFADVSNRVHPEVTARAIDAARIVGLDVAGIDLVATDIGLPLEDQGGAIVGVHPQPSLAQHLNPTAGTAQPVAEAIVARVFPEGSNGRIPIVAVTGVNGKTTTARLVGHVAARAYRCVGMTCTEGIYVDGRRIESGDCSGPQSARTVLTNPKVDVAVLETARGGILRAGLGFDRCDVAIVTNIGEGDHLGLGDIETPEELARVKRTIVDVVTKNGAAVLKADDPLTAEMASACSGHVIFFARDPQHPVLMAHRARNGRAAYIREGHIVLAEGTQEIPLVPLSRVPLTHSGRIAFQVDNCLAAAAACWSLGVKCETIRVGLETFGADMGRSPGRFNLFAVDGATVLLDYGHNAAALACVIDALKQIPARRRVAVYSTAGDRRDCDMMRQGELLGSFFDRVILFEDHYLRGRKEGEIIRLFREGVEKANPACEIEEVRGAVPGMQRALDTLQPADLVLLQADTVDESVDFMRKFLEEHSDDVREITLAQAIVAAVPQPTIDLEVGEVTPMMR